MVGQQLTIKYQFMFYNVFKLYYIKVHYNFLQAISFFYATINPKMENIQSNKHKL